MNMLDLTTLSIVAHANLASLAVFARTSNGGTIVLVIVSVLVIAGIAIGAYYGNRYMNWYRRESPHSLFMELCKLHSLDPRQKGLLRQVEAAVNPPHPGLLFTEQRWLDGAVVKSTFRPVLEDLKLLRQQLFMHSEHQEKQMDEESEGD